MAETPKNTLKQWFVTGAKPLQAQYWAWLDSYWHKSEAISINAIDGLGEILVNKVDADQLALYAKKDASNIDVPTWKTKLGVGDLPPNVATIDYVTPDGEAMIGNAYKKVVDPNDGKVYVLNIDGSKVAADTFGKNITNSSNTTTGSYIQTQRASDTFDWETNGARYAIKSLPDKSADAAFDDFVGKNSQGQLARVGYQAFYKAFQGFSAQQSLNLSQLLAGGSGSDGAPNVNLISPPIIQNQYDSVEYVLLRGVNLKLNTTAMSIQILASDRQTIVATIPNNQIQLSDDGLSLIFFYNFHNFPIDDFFIKLVSGSKVYISTLSIKIVQNVDNINVGDITWDIQYANGVSPNPNNVCQGGSFTVTHPLGISGVPSLNVKSAEIFPQGSDFYIEMKITLLSSYGNASTGGFKSYIGLGYSNSPNSAAISSLINTSFTRLTYNDAVSNDIFNNTNYMFNIGGATSEYSVIFIKTGNLFRTIIGNSNYSATLANNSGYSLFLNIVGFSKDSQIIQGLITKAFKFS